MKMLVSSFLHNIPKQHCIVTWLFKTSPLPFEIPPAAGRFAFPPPFNCFHSPQCDDVVIAPGIVLCMNRVFGIRQCKDVGAISVAELPAHLAYVQHQRRWAAEGDVRAHRDQGYFDSCFFCCLPIFFHGCFLKPNCLGNTVVQESFSYSSLIIGNPLHIPTPSSRLSQGLTLFGSTCSES